MCQGLVLNPLKLKLMFSVFLYSNYSRLKRRLSSLTNSLFFIRTSKNRLRFLTFEHFSVFLIFYSIQPQCSYVLNFFANSDKIVIKCPFFCTKWVEITRKKRPFMYSSGYWASIYNLKNKNRFEHEIVLKILTKSEPRCSYKIVLIKKSVINSGHKIWNI